MSTDYYYWVYQASDGGYYASGRTNSRGLLSKFSPNGTIEWSMAFGPGTGELIHCVKETIPDNGIIIVGQYEYTPGADILIAKLTPMGELEWANKMENNLFDFGYRIELLTSSSSPETTGFVICGFTLDPSELGYDALIAELSLDGSIIWTLQMGSNLGDDRATSMIISASDGNIVVSGHSCYGDTPTTQMCSEASSSRIFLAKISSDGALLWTKQLDYQTSFSSSSTKVVEIKGIGYFVVGTGTKGLDSKVLICLFSEEGELEFLSTVVGGNGVEYSIGRDLLVDEVEEDGSFFFTVLGVLTVRNKDCDESHYKPFLAKFYFSNNSNNKVVDSNNHYNITPIWSKRYVGSKSEVCVDSLSTSIQRSKLEYGGNDGYVSVGYKVYSEIHIDGIISLVDSRGNGCGWEDCEILPNITIVPATTPSWPNFFSRTGGFSISGISPPINYFASSSVELICSDNVICRGNETDEVDSSCIFDDRCHFCSEQYPGDYCTYVSKCGSTKHVCSGKGICKAPSSDVVCYEDGEFISDDRYVYRCYCNEHYFGEFCNITSCRGVLSNQTGFDVYNSDQCSDHGTCYNFNHCDCENGYFGRNCSITKCGDFYSNDTTNVCSGHGICGPPNSQPPCQCISSRYSGDLCNLWTCFHIAVESTDEVCSGHGQCIDFDRCECNSGYQEKNCSYWDCGIYSRYDSRVCSHRGECVGSHRCDCKNDYIGVLCESWSCGFEYDNPHTCNGNGVCLSPDICKCKTGHTGKYCQNSYLFNVIFYPLMVTGILFCCCFVIVLSFIFLVCCCTCFAIQNVICGGGIFYLTSKTVKLNTGITKYRKLKNFDVILKEQLLDDDTNLAHLRIKQEMFSIDMDEIEIISLLGEGGSKSIVFKGRWLGEIIAFKCFKLRHVLTSQIDYNDFEKEVEIFASISHPNILRFYGCSLKSPRVGIVMEFCENGELLEFVISYRENNKAKNDDGYPLREKIRMLGEIIHGMIYLHNRQIIHRDLKCENSLVDSQEKCKIMDFGLSRFYDRSSQTKTKNLGTSIYMAPELLNSDDGKYGTSCDAYSFAILSYILVSEDSNPFSTYMYVNPINIQFRVALDPNLRPDIDRLRKIVRKGEMADEVQEKGYEWIIHMITSCWKHDQHDRPSFVDIKEEYYK